MLIVTDRAKAILRVILDEDGIVTDMQIPRLGLRSGYYVLQISELAYEDSVVFRDSKPVLSFDPELDTTDSMLTLDVVNDGEFVLVETFQ